MIIILKNYPSVVDAKAWALPADMSSLTAAAKEATEMAKTNPDTFILPSLVAHSSKGVVGVTFDDVEGAVNQMYGMNWEGMVSYGDMILMGNRQELLTFPPDTKVYLWVKNDRGTQMNIVFDFKKYMQENPPRKSHRKGKTITNYSRPVAIPQERDAHTVTLISIMRDDEILVEDDVISVSTTDPTDTAFSILM